MRLCLRGSTTWMMKDMSESDVHPLPMFMSAPAPECARVRSHDVRRARRPSVCSCAGKVDVRNSILTWV